LGSVGCLATSANLQIFRNKLGFAADWNLAEVMYLFSSRSDREKLEKHGETNVRTKTSIHYILAMADHRIDHITSVTEHAQFRFEQGVSFARSLDNGRRNPAFGNPSPVRGFAKSGSRSGQRSRPGHRI
jgi:hypothetical protein